MKSLINILIQFVEKILKNVIKEYAREDGYIQCKMNRRTYLKHRIIALQFIDNPNNLPSIDHINHNRQDNRIENLRWVTTSDNNRNFSGRRFKYNFLDELPETAESLESYNGYEFDGLYIDYENEKLYLFNGVIYRELVPWRKGGNIYYKARDIEDVYISLSHKILFS